MIKKSPNKTKIAVSQIRRSTKDYKSLVWYRAKKDNGEDKRDKHQSSFAVIYILFSAFINWTTCKRRLGNLSLLEKSSWLRAVMRGSICFLA